jgi:soluble lytic murein transglycosylase-like protein
MTTNHEVAKARGIGVTNLVTDPKRQPLEMARRIMHVPQVRYSSAEVSHYIREALRITHSPESWSRPLYWMAYQESRFYVCAVDGEVVRNVNLAGESQHALGLMQVVPSTFQRHAIRDMQDIWNPVDNTVAAVRYIRGRYGTPYKIPGVFRVSEYNGY